jgi:FkbM family methyltransferase
VNGLRSTLRRTGLIRIASLPAHTRTLARRLSFALSRPEAVEARIGDLSARIVVSDDRDYARALSYREDRHILEALLGRLREGDTCWDVGASFGLYSVLLAKAVGAPGRVIAFEPEARSFEKLRANVAANGLSNVRIVRKALGDVEAKGTLEPAAHGSAGTHRVTSTSEGEVEVVPGDLLRTREGWPVPAAIKIDVEGMEENVLLGVRETLSDPRCKTVVCEVHFGLLEAAGQGETPARLVDFLRDRGFERTVWLDRSHLAAYK